jgi:ABC-type glutathione transport system ATPase component
MVRHLNIWACIKGGQRNQIVRDVSFSVAGGIKLAMVGRSGCGKTMTAMSILGLLPDNCRASGSILWNNKQILGLPAGKHRRLLGKEHVLIPQSGADFLNPSLTVRRQLTETLVRNGVPKKDHGDTMKRKIGRAHV